MAEHEMLKVDRSMLPPNKKTDTTERREEKSTAPKLEPVVKRGTVVRQKQPIGKRIRSLFIADDIEDVGSYLVDDLIIPFIKNTVVDLVEIIMFGQTSVRRTRRGRNDRYSNLPTDYSAKYSPRDRDRTRSRRRGTDYKNIVITDPKDARELVDSIQKRIALYGSANVGDLLELIDETPTYTDLAYGWKDPDQIGLRRVGQGWLIDVDDAEPLDN